MIPTTLLTALHYVSLVAAVAVLLLLGWQYFKSSGTE